MLKVNQQEIKLGTVKLKQDTKFKFVLTNTSEAPVAIAKIVLGCQACTRASVAKVLLASNESVDLNVVFTPNSTGLAAKEITVRAVTPEGKPLEPLSLKFTAQVKE